MLYCTQCGRIIWKVTGEGERNRLPAGHPHNKKTYGHHVTLVPVIFNIELQLFQDVGVLIREETLSQRERDIRISLDAFQNVLYGDILYQFPSTVVLSLETSLMFIRVSSSG